MQQSSHGNEPPTLETALPLTNLTISSNFVIALRTGILLTQQIDCVSILPCGTIALRYISR